MRALRGERGVRGSREGGGVRGSREGFSASYLKTCLSEWIGRVKGVRGKLSVSHLLLCPFLVLCGADNQ